MGGDQDERIKSNRRIDNNDSGGNPHSYGDLNGVL